MFATAYDWELVFRPAALALLSGAPMPHGFFSPTWVLFPLIPFALLPVELGRWLMFVCALVSCAYVAWSFGAKPVGVLAFLASPLVILSLLEGNVEWLTLLGFVAAPPVSVLLLLIKPQMTFAAVLFLAWWSWRCKRLTRFAIVPSIVIALALATGWLDTLARYSHDADVNASWFPWSLAVGLPLVVYAIRKVRFDTAVAASPCFAPTLSPQSWSIALLAIAGSTPELIAASAGLWVCVALGGVR